MLVTNLITYYKYFFVTIRNLLFPKSWQPVSLANRRSVSGVWRSVAQLPDYLKGHFWLYRTYLLSIIFALFLTIYSAVTVAAKSDSTVILGKGLKYYQEGQYDQARDTFQSLLEVHSDNAALLFNLGLTQYHLGHYGLAIGLWRKALHQNPYLVEANQAINFAQKRHIQAPQQQGQISWMERLRNWVLIYISLDLCLFLTAVFGFFFLWFKIKYLILRNSALKKASYPPVIPTSLIALGSIWVFILLITMLKTKDYLTPRATIITPKVTAKVGPSDETASLFELAEGQDVTIKQIYNDWVQIHYLEEQTGWVQQKDIFHYAGEKLW